MRTFTLETDIMTQWLSTLPIPGPSDTEREGSTVVDLWRYGINDLDGAKAALTEAERVIRSQEERIRQLEGLALSDELTGLLNRRGFQLMLKREISYARRDDTATGVLIMVDLDGFKKINDNLGHAAGDAYLKECAEQLVKAVRENDYVARLGGDEFAVVLTRIDAEVAHKRLPQIEAFFSRQEFKWNGSLIPLRASFGMSAYAGTSAVEDIMAEADLRLYAKKGKR